MENVATTGRRRRQTSHSNKPNASRTPLFKIGENAVYNVVISPMQRVRIVFTTKAALSPMLFMSTRSRLIDDEAKYTSASSYVTLGDYAVDTISRYKSSLVDYSA